MTIDQPSEDAPGIGADAEGVDGDPADGSPTVDDPNQVSFLGAEEGTAPPAQAQAAPDGAAPDGSAPAEAAPDGSAPAEAAPAEAAGEYLVLARKYRPQSFADLIGQEALVRTLTNAFATGRLAHAFLLTGVRGVGKTTTARIIAKGLNCTGPDGTGGPTISPCGTCENCRAIAGDRHMDVIEMDAASRTGVDDVREILEGVRYRPVSAKYKVYIIDEVHMLSRHAFNALLKTLEEPPQSVKFIFATTDVRKLPVTVLSRCQRFDLRRVGDALLMEHLGKIGAAEGATLDDDALRLLARAADGSVRDGLSLLDQAIALHHGQDGAITAAQMGDMLGRADAGQIYDLFEQIMRGKIADALELLKTTYDSGAEPLTVLQNLLDLVHWVTRIKASPAAVKDTALSELERVRGGALADGLSMPVLTRAWQLLLKGIGEVQMAPAAYDAAEMVLIRLAYAADLPTPGEVIKRLENSPGDSPAEHQGENQSPAAPAAAPQAAAPAQGGGPAGEALAAAAEQSPAPADSAGLDEPRSFADLVAMFGSRREVELRNHLYRNVHLVSYEPGRLDINPGPEAPRDLAGRVVDCLRQWLGPHWNVTVSNAAGQPPLAQLDEVARAAEHSAAAKDPIVREVLDTFPGATIERVTPKQDLIDGAGLDDPDDLAEDESE